MGQVNKGQVKKANFTNHKLAPPSGWKVPNNMPELSPNPDLIDLLNTRDKQGVPQKKIEEKKEDKTKTKEVSSPIVDNLLDLDFSPSVQVTSNVANNANTENKKQADANNFDFWNTAPNDNASDKFDFGNFDTMQNTPSKGKESNGNNSAKKNISSPFAFTQPQMYSDKKQQQQQQQYRQFYFVIF